MSHGHRNVVTRQHIFSCVKEEVSTLMIPCCVGCGEFIDDDTKAVQCEMCVSCETWKYAAGCLDLTDEMYCHLATSSKSNFHWFCEKCEATALEADSCSDDKILSQINGLHSKTDNIEHHNIEHYRGMSDDVDRSCVAFSMSLYRLFIKRVSSNLFSVINVTDLTMLYVQFRRLSAIDTGNADVHRRQHRRLDSCLVSHGVKKTCP